jgi:ornithine cyclodeaminase/alanine dehydrogenase-like protein (mu-crystallin family)
VKCLDPRALVDRLAEAFQLHSLRENDESLPSTDFDMGSGLLSTSRVATMEGVPAYAVKLESRMPGRNPSISGLLHLYDSESGALLAVMESSHISSLGSALIGALAADLLALPEAASVAMVGNGIQGWLGLRFLMEMRPVEQVNLFDLNRRKSRRTAERLKKYEGLEVKVCDSLNEAVCQADIICCATWSQRPFLFSEMVKPGAHVSTLGSDGIGKRELSRELLESCSFYCDDRDLATSVGALSDLIDGSGMVKAELGDILAGNKPGRLNEEEVTVYGPVGLPFVDLIAAWETYRRARRKKVGRTFGVWD